MHIFSFNYIYIIILRPSSILFYFIFFFFSPSTFLSSCPPVPSVQSSCHVNILTHTNGTTLVLAHQGTVCLFRHLQSASDLLLVNSFLTAKIKNKSYRGTLTYLIYYVLFVLYLFFSFFSLSFSLFVGMTLLSISSSLQPLCTWCYI